MPRVKITGEVTIRITQYLHIPENEVAELLGDDENLKVNVDEEECQKDIIEWHWISGVRHP